MLKMVDQSSNFVIWIDFEDFGQLKNILLLETRLQKFMFLFFMFWSEKWLEYGFYMFKI
jgi:hypothetical protein